MANKDYYEVVGGTPLSGSVTISGSKNAALPIICASVLADSPSTIENLPDIEDVNRMIEILKLMGAEVERIGNGVIRVNPTDRKSVV